MADAEIVPVLGGQDHGARAPGREGNCSIPCHQAREGAAPQAAHVLALTIERRGRPFWERRGK